MKRFSFNDVLADFIWALVKGQPAKLRAKRNRELLNATPYIIGRDNKHNHEFILHMRCGFASYNTNDIEFKYCGMCHEFLNERR